MSRIQEKTVYTFDELGNSAKEKAREWYRSLSLDYEWWDSVYEYTAECGKILGIDLRQKRVNLMGGGARLDPAIFFSGFSSQGDGASYEASYSYAKGCARSVRRYAPKDTELHGIADELVALQRAHFYQLVATTRHTGRASHSLCMSVDVGHDDGWDVPREAEEALRDILRSFADWIYSRLQAEYEYLMSDESVDEFIRCNVYEFDEDGNIA